MYIFVGITANIPNILHILKCNTFDFNFLSEPSPLLLCFQTKLKNILGEKSIEQHPQTEKEPPTTKGKKQPKKSQAKITDNFKKAKKTKEPTKPKRVNNRFNGMSEEEIAKKGLPDYLKPGLDIVFIGINPSMFAAYTGKYYDGPGNHFWKALYMSGFLPEPMGAEDDYKLLDLGIGFTNVVPRTTRGLSDLSKKEIAEGAKVYNYVFKLDYPNPLS